MTSYTVEEFVKRYRKGDGKGHVRVYANALDKDHVFHSATNQVICDSCNAEIKQPVGEPDKKVVWIYGSDAYCEKCNSKVPQNLNDIRSFVYDGLFNSVKSGWAEFQDSSMTADKWSHLSDDEKERYPIRLTKKGLAEPTIFNALLKNIEKKSAQFSNHLITDVSVADDGMITFILTDDGILMKKFYESVGGDFSTFLHNNLSKGLDRMMSGYIMIDGKVMFGHSRVGLMPNL